MNVTVTQGKNKAVFTWDESCNECDYVAIGFSDDEIDEMIEQKIHMGAQTDGYEVEVLF